MFHKMETMKWEKLLSPKRFGSSRGARGENAGSVAGNFSHDNGVGGEIRVGGGAKRRDNNDGRNRSEFERDYGRVLYSSAFRRLQDKTQVFPLGRNDYVRTRLTHSCEVSHVGNSIGMWVGNELVRRHDLRRFGIAPEHFAYAVSAACLAHDVGNPPFGHLGENAIEAALKKIGYDRKFEGNAQGFRLLTRVLDPIDGRGLRLTAATLGAFSKYPCTEKYSAEQAAAGVVAIECKKFGYIPEDAEAMRFVAEETGMLPRGCDKAGFPAWCRHPLAFLTEAADDLCYLVADIEDACVSNVISFENAFAQLGRFLSADEREYARRLASRESESGALHYMRATVIGVCIRAVCETFLANEDAILAGKFSSTLIEKSCLGRDVAELREFSEKFVYNAKQVIEIGLCGVNVIRALVKFFGEWVKNPAGSESEKIGIFAGETAAKCKTEEERLLCMLDYISGMTDSFALATYHKIFGT